jgi:hypothetical protein
MHAVRGSVALAISLVLSACGEERRTMLAPELPEAPALAAGGVAASVSGSGHHVRIGAEGEELTTLAFSAIRHTDGGTTGQWEYHFRAAGFSMHGAVTCFTIAGHEAWMGGFITKVLSPDPADQELVGIEMWWRSRDNGQGSTAPPDSTTGLGFKFPGVTITAESWCRDQPQALTLREVVAGNILIRDE